MFKFALAALLCAQAYARPSSEIQPHVVNGITAKEGQFPYAVAIRKLNDDVICGGALISDRYVLTSAFCIYRVIQSEKLTRVGVGSINPDFQTVYEIEKLIGHPRWGLHGPDYDLALIRLKESVKLTDKVKTIDFSPITSLVGKNATSMGWGCTSHNGPTSGVLKYLERKIVENLVCSELNIRPVLENEFCWENQWGSGMCQLDYGGPVVTKTPDGKDHLIGVVTQRVSCSLFQYDIFTKLSLFHEWIVENMI